MLLKVLNLKLGGQCNLACKYCHCERSSYKFNKDIIDFINNNHYDRISFSGGEPLLYFGIIKQIIAQIDGNPSLKMVSNGSLLTEEMVKFFNDHLVQVVVSYDGENDQRDISVSPVWEMVRELKNSGFSVCCGPGNMGFANIISDIDSLKNRYDLKNIHTPAFAQQINFLHQTDHACGIEFKQEDIDSYVQQYQVQLDLMFENYVNGYPLKNSFLLKQALKKWYIEKDYNGVACCNDKVHTLTLDGRFMLCGYGHEFVGDIYNGINFDKVYSYLPARCKNCSIWNVCKNTCIANITDNECEISKRMNRYLTERVNTLNIKERIMRDFEEGDNNNL